MGYSKNASLCTDHLYKTITYDYQNLNFVELQKNQNEDKRKRREMEEKNDSNKNGKIGLERKQLSIIGDHGPWFPFRNAVRLALLKAATKNP